VIEETKRRLGKMLAPDEMMRLYGIYEDLRLPSEVILLLITHCIRESRVTGDGRAPSVRYIEKAAYTWEREGIFTLERAEEYLKALEAKKSVRGEMKRVLWIRDREFSATEKRYVDDWIEMGFEPEAIAIAYDKTVTKTGSLAWPYIDKIVKNWHSKGLHTAHQIQENENGQKNSAHGRVTSSNNKKHGEPNRADIERMQRLLNKAKNE
jgi:DnaD/phage-associated family protein